MNPSIPPLKATLFVLDTEKEAELGIGRLFKHRPLGPAEAHASAILLRGLRVPQQRGGRISISFNFLDAVGLSADGIVELAVGAAAPAAADASILAPNGALDTGSIAAAALEAVGMDLDAPRVINVGALAADFVLANPNLFTQGGSRTINSTFVPSAQPPGAPPTSPPSPPPLDATFLTVSVPIADIAAVLNTTRVSVAATNGTIPGANGNLTVPQPILDAIDVALSAAFVFANSTAANACETDPMDPVCRSVTLRLTVGDVVSVLRSLPAINTTWRAALNSSLIPMVPVAPIASAVVGAVSRLPLTFTVVDGVSSPVGKVPSALGSLIIVDSKHIIQSLGDSFGVPQIMNLLRAQLVVDSSAGGSRGPLSVEVDSPAGGQGGGGGMGGLMGGGGGPPSDDDDDDGRARAAAVAAVPADPDAAALGAAWGVYTAAMGAAPRGTHGRLAAATAWGGAAAAPRTYVDTTTLQSRQSHTAHPPRWGVGGEGSSMHAAVAAADNGTAGSLAFSREGGTAVSEAPVPMDVHAAHRTLATYLLALGAVDPTARGANRQRAASTAGGADTDAAAAAAGDAVGYMANVAAPLVARVAAAMAAAARVATPHAPAALAHSDDDAARRAAHVDDVVAAVRSSAAQREARRALGARDGGRQRYSDPDAWPRHSATADGWGHNRDAGNHGPLLDQQTYATAGRAAVATAAPRAIAEALRYVREGARARARAAAAAAAAARGYDDGDADGSDGADDDASIDDMSASPVADADATAVDAVYARYLADKSGTTDPSSSSSPSRTASPQRTFGAVGFLAAIGAARAAAVRRLRGDVAVHAAASAGTAGRGGGEAVGRGAVTAQTNRAPSTTMGASVLRADDGNGTQAGGTGESREFGHLTIGGRDVPLYNLSGVFDLAEFAMAVVVPLSDRVAVYSEAEEARSLRMIRITDAMFKAVGLRYPAAITAPLVVFLQTSEMIKLFLSSVIVMLAILMAILGSILVFSLLGAAAQQRTYEYGMLRALGLSAASLSHSVVISTALFAVPGTIIGLIMSTLAYYVLQLVLQSVAYLPVTLWLPFDAWFYPALVGLIVPTIANIYPILRAARSRLRDALDIAHSTMNDVTVTMLRLENLGLNPWTSGVALLIVVFGFVTYYLLPLSFILNDMPLFFLILDAMLALMILGLCIVSLALQSVFEKVVLWCLLWGRDRRFDALIKRNLSGHRIRSRFTYIMFVISVASLIFGGVLTELLGSSIGAQIEAITGAQVRVDSFSSTFPLQRPTVDSLLARLATDDAVGRPVQSWSWLTAPLADHYGVGATRYSNLIEYPTFGMNTIGVEESFVDTIYTALLMTDEVAPQVAASGKDIVRAMYTIEPPMYSYRPPNVLGAQRPWYANSSTNVTPSAPVPAAAPLPPAASTRDANESASTGTYTLKTGSIDDGAFWYIAPTSYTYWTSVRAADISKVAVEVRSSRLGVRGVDFALPAYPAAMMVKVPGFFYNSLSLVTPFMPMIVSIPTFQGILNQSLANVAGYVAGRGGNTSLVPASSTIRWQSVLVKLRSNATATARADVVSALAAVMSDDLAMITDTVQTVNDIGSVVSLILILFYYVSAGQMLLDFFMLATATAANVRSNLWEFGVARAIGVTKGQLTRVLLYEALSVVVSAFAVGVVVGAVTASTFVALFLSILEIPFPAAFPYVLFGVLLVGSLLATILAATSTGNLVNRMPIAKVLKGLM